MVGIILTAENPDILGGKRVSLYFFLRHKSHMDWAGMNPCLRIDEAGG